MELCVCVCVQISFIRIDSLFSIKHDIFKYLFHNQMWFLFCSYGNNFSYTGRAM